MEYRIRYRSQRDNAETEVTVQANSPTEAIVKFRHTHGLGKAGQDKHEVVTSVYTEPCLDAVSW